MAVSNVLKNLRQADYGSKPSGPSDEKETESVRSIKLTDDEMKDLQGYQKAPGEELVCEVSGKLEDDGHFHVMSVRPAGGGGMDKDMAAGVAGIPPPMMRG